MATNESKQSRAAVAPPPRTLNVQKFAESRALELDSLHSIVSTRLSNDFRSQRNKRRRTTGYDNRLAKNKGRKRQKLGFSAGKDDPLNDENDKKEKVPRRVRRRAELRKNPETGFCTSGDGSKRLRTHVWHAKRFTMSKLWGFHLPFGLQGRGRGSRALLKKFKQGALVHDASYYGVIQMEGPEGSLLSVLKMVLRPSPSELSEDVCHSLLSGVVYGNAMLHKVGAYDSVSIAPMTYMWRRFSQQKRGIDKESLDCNGHSEHHRTECSFFRQLWVCIHGSAFTEGYDALKFACAKQTNETGIFINCFSLEGQLAKLEVMGLKSFQLLQKILHPVICSSDCPSQLKGSVEEADTENHLWKSSVLEIEDHVPSHAIISLTVIDPRSLPEKRSVITPEATPSNTFMDGPDDEAKENAMLADIRDKEKGPLSSLLLNHEEIDNKVLWDVSNGMSPPLEENLLCMEKHHQRLASFCLGDRNSRAINDSAEAKCSKSCPIMLLKDANLKGSPIGWSVMLPMSWVKAFWIPLVSNGAHAVGLREKHWIACEVGWPCFPFDFPDTHAYSYFKATEAAAFDQKVERRHPVVRPLRVPIPPPWSCVRLAFDEGSTEVGDAHSCENSLTNSDSQNTNVSLLGHYVKSFKGFVARTSNMLKEFLREIRGDHLLLFPFTPDRKESFSKMYESKLTKGQIGATQLNNDRKLCFVRVLLHAFKEGVFEEGAVVCAPHPTDITLWTSRSENNEEGFQIPQSSVSLYFREQSSGIWELHIPEDSISRKSHRWPIGFVTTGFVRGSKKPMAGALCEATLLARLREEQWKEMSTKQRRKEIYVLVRNLRSAAYRLALATIVLEQWEEDVDSL